jgi:hypothetical protein
LPAADEDDADVIFEKTKMEMARGDKNQGIFTFSAENGTGQGPALNLF